MKLQTANCKPNSWFDRLTMSESGHFDRKKILLSFCLLQFAVFLSIFFISPPLLCKEGVKPRWGNAPLRGPGEVDREIPEEAGGRSIFSYFKNKDVDIFPVPIFETRPDKGNSYGLMPVILLSDREDRSIKSIFAMIGQYNSVTKFDGAALAYFYPQPEQEILFFAEFAQHYAREVSLRFFDPRIFDKFYLKFDFIYSKTPFGHFFGLGPLRTEENRSNYTSRNFNTDITFGYYLIKNLRANITARFHTTDILTRAMEEFDDTLTRYGGLPNVVDSTNCIYEFSFVFDNRLNREYSKNGSLAKLAYFFSSKTLGSDKTFQGWNLEAIHIFPLYKDIFTTAFRFHLQEVFGRRTPFYELSSLGGPNEFRAFTPLRFVDQGKIIFQIEERIRLFKWKLFGIPFEGYADPFLEIGRVFDAVNHLGFDDWQPVGGLGLRLFVPPNVVGRVDLAAGSDGFEIYTVLGYPF